MSKRLCDILEHSNGVATGQLIATQTAELVVENRKLNNKIEALERTIVVQTVELTTLKQLNEEQKLLNGEQAKELIALRNARASYLGTASSATGSVTRPGSSVYLRR